MAPSRTAVAAGLVAAAAAAYAAFRASAKRRGAAEAEEAAGVGAGAGSEAKGDVAGASTIRVNVLFFASAREMAGCDTYEAVLPAGARTSALRQALKDRFKLLGEGAMDTPLAINEQYARPRRPLTPGRPAARPPARPPARRRASGRHRAAPQVGWDEDPELAGGDEVALIPPISGG